MRAFLVCVVVSVSWPVAANQDKATTRTLVAVLAHPAAPDIQA